MKKLIVFVLISLIVISSGSGATKKISELTALTTISGTSLLEVAYKSGGTYYSRKMTWLQLVQFMRDSVLMPDSITAGMIASDVITSRELASNSVGAAELAANAIDSNDVASGGINSTNIHDHTITATDLSTTVLAMMGEYGAGTYPPDDVSLEFLIDGADTTLQIKSSYLQTFYNVADTTTLKTLSGSGDGALRYLRALGAAGFGGGWFVYMDSTYKEGIIAFGSGTIGKQWTRIDWLKDKNTVSVKWVGAVGDGSTSDNTAVLRAISSGYDVYFPKGTYKVTSNSIALSAGQKLFGEGTIKCAATSGTGSFSMANNVQIKDLIFWGSTGYSIFRNAGADSVVFKNVTAYITAANQVPVMQSGGGHNYFYDCRFFNHAWNHVSQSGIYFSGLASATADTSYWYECDLRTDVYCWYGLTDDFVSFEGCDLENTHPNSGACLDPYGGASCIFRGGSMRSKNCAIASTPNSALGTKVEIIGATIYADSVTYQVDGAKAGQDTLIITDSRIVGKKYKAASGTGGIVLTDSYVKLSNVTIENFDDTRYVAMGCAATDSSVVYLENVHIKNGSLYLNAPSNSGTHKILLRANNLHVIYDNASYASDVSILKLEGLKDKSYIRNSSFVTYQTSGNIVSFDMQTTANDSLINFDDVLFLTKLTYGNSTYFGRGFTFDKCTFDLAGSLENSAGVETTLRNCYVKSSAATVFGGNGTFYLDNTGASAYTTNGSVLSIVRGSGNTVPVGTDWPASGLITGELFYKTDYAGADTLGIWNSANWKKVEMTN